MVVSWFKRLMGLGLFVAVLAGLPGLAKASTRTELQARYNLLAAAMSSSDGRTVENFLAPDFTNVDMSGHLNVAKDFVTMIGDRQITPTIKLRIKVLSVKADRNAVTVEQTMQVEPAVPGKTKFKGVWLFHSEDHWKKIDDTWMLQSMHQDKADFIVNGKVKEHRDGIAPAVRPLPAETTFTDMSMGNPKAKVTIIQYGSVACPICARVDATVMPEFIKKYVDTGEVLYIYRPLQTGNPAVALTGHLLAECAGKDKYFAVVDAIMQSQDEMDKGGPTEAYVNAHPVLARIAHQAGLSDQQFESCVNDKDGISRMNKRNQAYLKRDSIQGTPTFFVNGNEITGFADDISFFDNAIQPLLK